MLNPDFRDMLSEFGAAGVEYLIVGGYAVAHHGYVRATGDLDFWVRRTQENAERVLHALEAFGAPAGLVTRDDLQQAGHGSPGRRYRRGSAREGSRRQTRV